MEQKILSTFLHNHKLKFSEIERLVKVRSNKLSYYLKKLEKKGILVKEGDFYKLSETAEFLIPYLSKKNSILPVVLIAIKKDSKNIFLYKRIKRPYKDFLSLPGGRIILGETIPKATGRIIKEKFNIKCKFRQINSVSLEQVKKNKKIIHSFLLIFVTALTKDNLEYIDIEKNKEKIIKSDYKLIKSDLKKEIKIENIFSNI
jgi:ADP-ribose pyrophosphatase YjhB (NUDIX family)